MKYALDQTIYYMEDNKVHSAPVLSRMLVENLNEEWSNKTFEQFGKSCVRYATCHGVYEEGSVFGSKEDLLRSL